MFKDILLSASLCADCFAVALCASVSMKNVRWTEVLRIALIFAVIQTSFLAAGWAFGDFISRYIMKIVKYVGMALLIFVGSSMIREAFSDEEPHSLTGFCNIVLAGVADSIDAFSVFIFLLLAGCILLDMWVTTLAFFIFTSLSVSVGIKGVSFIGGKAGRPAAITVRIVLILLGINIPLGLF